MNSILHISDLHFGPYYLPAIGESVLELAGILNPDVIVASGDFTQRAKPEEFQQAAEFLQKLPRVPTVVTPGNHDVPLYRVWERIANPYGNYREHIREELEEVIRHPGLCIAALNSTAPYRAITNGRIDPSQLEFCNQAFADSPSSDLRVVVAHHHFAPAPDYEHSQVMPGAKSALDRLERLKVELILGGHLHRAFIGNSLDIYSGADRERGIVIAQCGTTTSRRGRAREREKNSFNLITYSDNRLVVTHWMYSADRKTFLPMSEHTFPRGTSAWLDD